MSRTNGLMIVGVIFLSAGLLGFAIPVSKTEKTEDVVRLGDVRIQSTQDVSHNIPPILSGGLLILGVVLIGVGVYRRN